jgi:hypothetical protein
MPPAQIALPKIIYKMIENAIETIHVDAQTVLFMAISTFNTSGGKHCGAGEYIDTT